MDHTDFEEPKTFPFQCPQCEDRMMVTLPPRAAVGHIGATTCSHGHFVAYRFDGARLVSARSDQPRTIVPKPTPSFPKTPE